MMPPLEDLLKFTSKREAAAKYDVTQKTITNWLKYYGVYKATPKYGPNKLNIEKAQEIRRLHKEGKSRKELAKMFGVTFSTISRVIHNLIHKECDDVAKVSVIYNINSGTN